jgi:hypothetical protein
MNDKLNILWTAGNRITSLSDEKMIACKTLDKKRKKKNTDYGTISSTTQQ